MRGRVSLNRGAIRGPLGPSEPGGVLWPARTPSVKRYRFDRVGTAQVGRTATHAGREHLDHATRDGRGSQEQDEDYEAVSVANA